MPLANYKLLMQILLFIFKIDAHKLEEVFILLNFGELSVVDCEFNFGVLGHNFITQFLS